MKPIKEHYATPFRVKGFDDGLIVVEDAAGLTLCEGMTEPEGQELCSIINAHFEKKEEPKPEPEPPKPNREETDRVAMEFIKSGRTITVQYFKDSMWRDMTTKESLVPSFNYDLPWRIKPKKRRVVVEIYKTPHGDVVSRIYDGMPYRSDFILLGTLEGEVEA